MRTLCHTSLVLRERSASTSTDSQELSAHKLPTGIVLEDLVVSKLPQALPFGFRGGGQG